MSDIALTAPPRGKTIAIWALRIIIAALFLFTGAAKLAGQPMTIEEFDAIGLGQWFRYVTGLIEVGGAVMVLIPAASMIGAIVVLLVIIGAFFAQAFVLRMDIIHPIVIALAIGALLVLQRRTHPIIP
jgi:putative oxidoreductase